MLFLTVFVDLIVAVGVGVFIANILTIDRLSELQSQEVKTISDTDDAIVLNNEEKRLLDLGLYRYEYHQTPCNHRRWMVGVLANF